MYAGVDPDEKRQWMLMHRHGRSEGLHSGGKSELVVELWAEIGIEIGVELVVRQRVKGVEADGWLWEVAFK